MGNFIEQHPEVDSPMPDGENAIAFFNFIFRIFSTMRTPLLAGRNSTSVTQEFAHRDSQRNSGTKILPKVTRWESIFGRTGTGNLAADPNCGNHQRCQISIAPRGYFCHSVFPLRRSRSTLISIRLSFERQHASVLVPAIKKRFQTK